MTNADDRMPLRRILITGASVAGNALAWWLSRRGFEVTVVERHPQFRDGGQNIDVRGAGRKVLAMMGLEDAVAESGTGETGIRFVNENDDTIAQFDVDETGSDGPTAELEILRGDLACILFDACADAVHFRFDDSINSVVDDGQKVSVTFASGQQAEYDHVIVAEGVGSSTRELVFKDENEPRWLDVTMGYFTIPKGSGDTDHCRIFTAGEGRSIWLRPDNRGTTRAILVVQKEADGDEALSNEEQEAFLRERFTDAGWEAGRVLKGLEATDDLYFDVLRQVKMDRWSKGRVILTGDAAWCATPIAGVGTTLAIVGAYVLAGELAHATDLSTALRRYENIMRPFVEKGQGVPKIAPKMLQPQTRFGVALQRAVLRVASTPGVKQLAVKVFATSADDIDLPEYEAVPLILRPSASSAGRGPSS
ncbi:FAD-dependent monooxygenase [Neorhizobium alkalisoli]|uniref:2-polyprenyl-6-methoxyphenol hydroxylase-like FAD-dependent oxidoreductase n=1 Tax=Neorhizobium alkalisoli TaxID=528178 RepID=A0A561PZ54_9HYPH|nr:FAD-dependent monooxygenase [Neorhizobium alkalisoli]TWF43359.1 2-polyprenyl-6-methoxyphenol hydroxylase-like FAD-dependent oxidoreductase [Neorhizobium alkalisoli]